MPVQHAQRTFRVFVATWNVGGKSPHKGLNLDGILQVNNESDIYVLGFQETVPLNAGNVLVVEDNEPAAKWLALINQSLNKSCVVSSKGLKSSPSFGSGSLFFPKPSLKKISESFRTESRRRLKICNCSPELEPKNGRELCFRCQQSFEWEYGMPPEREESGPVVSNILGPFESSQIKYSLVASKRMVGLFLTIWMRTELIQHVSHLRISSVTRGIMGCLGNKGCIAVSMSFFKTSLCFICSHLASGQKDGDELRRNSDVTEILKNTVFPRNCRNRHRRIPERILEHERIIWLGDLNYRICLNYSDARKLVERNDWETLLNQDQLKIERDARRVFNGWKEGKIFFAPTYKYSYNSDTYAGETIKERNKRRTPAWCDRILWRGEGIRQLRYVRDEIRFSDHRPVCALFLVEVDASY